MSRKRQLLIRHFRKKKQFYFHSISRFSTAHFYFCQFWNHGTVQTNTVRVQDSFSFYLIYSFCSWCWTLVFLNLSPSSSALISVYTFLSQEPMINSVQVISESSSQIHSSHLPVYIWKVLAPYLQIDFVRI